MLKKNLENVLDWIVDSRARVHFACALIIIIYLVICFGVGYLTTLAIDGALIKWSTHEVIVLEILAQTVLGFLILLATAIAYVITVGGFNDISFYIREKRANKKE